MLVLLFLLCAGAGAGGVGLYLTMLHGNPAVALEQPRVPAVSVAVPAPEPPPATEPARPVTTEPSKPAPSEPAKPAVTEPAKPAATEPAKPAATESAKPVAPEPAKPAGPDSAPAAPNPAGPPPTTPRQPERPPEPAPKQTEPAAKQPEPMPPDGDRQVVMLPGAVSDVVSGAGGRILFLTCASERQLVVFDVAAKKVVTTVPLPAYDVKVAAGIDKFFMAVPGARRVDRYDLATLTPEASAELPSTPQALCMGSASRGPLLAVLARKPGVIDQESQAWFLDAATLAPLRLQADKRLSDVKPRLVRASADGRVFAWREALGGEPHSVCSVILHGTEAAVHTTSTSSGLVCPAADGRYIYGGWGVYTAELDPVFPRPIPQSFGKPFIPAEQGPYFAKLDWKDWEKLGGTLEFFREGEEEPFAKSGPIEGVTSEQVYYGDLRNKLTHDQRVRVFPDANLIVTIPGSNDRLILYHFDLKAAQKAGGR